ncbi:MAG: UvrD-helicase domain-containing protein, partial [Vicinamibacterales bacterium]
VGDPKQSIYRFRRADVGIYGEVCRQLRAQGARLLHLTTSFRSVPEIQVCVNTAFAPVMTGDDVTLQAPYVPLAPHRSALPHQPSVVVLPVPEPYAKRYVSAVSIEKSLPAAVGAFVDWIVSDSGWKVTERSGTGPVRAAAKHICLLFRRFVSWQTDVTRPYVTALEARGIAHVLVGGRAFHEREEIEAIRAALAAIEWPDDELSVFATLRGPFFAIGDEELLEWAHRFGRQTEKGFRRHVFHPYRVPELFKADTPADVEHLRPIAGALGVLRRLHARRNYVPVSETLHELLGATRAHVGFALRTGGEQALANVLHVAELARQYEIGGGISFRGFVEELRSAAETAQAAEAPILEEDSDGVRMMTVHKAKGLEFPIVILADLTCRLSRSEAGRWIDPAVNLCAVKLGGWAPADLLLHDAEEAARDRAEGERLAYVAATRARDVLVIPAIGDEVYEGGWLDPLMPAVHPPAAARRKPSSAIGCPAFPSKDTVVTRPDGDPARSTTVAPGAYVFDGGDVANREPTNSEQRTAKYSVVWWDPHILALDAGFPFGLRRDDLIAKDGNQRAVAARMKAYDDWRTQRGATAARASIPTLTVRTATDVAGDRACEWAGTEAVEIETIDVTRAIGRPFGPRFGTLVHATLATAPFAATEDAIRRIARTQGRIVLAADEEVYGAVEVVSAVLRHPLFERVRAAEAAGRCYRELPVIWQAPDGSLIEGTVDLAFEESESRGRGSESRLVVLDFKTDRELDADAERYRRQLTIYCRALSALRDQRSIGILMRI